MITKELLIKLVKEQRPEAKYITVDADGAIRSYLYKPEKVDRYWRGSTAMRIEMPNSIWENSLIEIPEEERHDLTWARDRMLERKTMKKIMMIVLLVTMVLSILTGRVVTFHMTEGEAFIYGWFFWLAAIVSAIGAIMLCECEKKGE